MSEKGYDMLHIVELMFRKNQEHLIGQSNVKKTLMDEAENLTKEYELPTCHNLKYKLLSKFITARLHFYCKKINAEHKKKTGEKKEGRT